MSSRVSLVLCRVVCILSKSTYLTVVCCYLFSSNFTRVFLLEQWSFLFSQHLSPYFSRTKQNNSFFKIETFQCVTEMMTITDCCFAQVCSGLGRLLYICTRTAVQMTTSQARNSIFKYKKNFKFNVVYTTTWYSWFHNKDFN